MQAIIVEQIGSFRVAEVPPPRPAPGEARIRVAVAGLCRTDLKLIEAGHRDLVLPRIPGEETVGVVDEVASPADHGLLGTRVYVYPGAWCGTCPACLGGFENLCRQMRIMGFHRDGGFAAHVTAPRQSLIPIPEGLDFNEAVLTEPLSCCLNALELSGVRQDQRLSIWGAGPAGSLLQRAARARGTIPTVIEPDPRRRALAGGVETPPPEPCDAAIVAVGDASAYHRALATLGPRGRLVLFSGLAPQAAVQPVDLNALHYREQSLVGAYGCSYRHGVEALGLIASGRVPVRDLVSHRLPLDRLSEALEIVRRKIGMKILLYPK